MISECCANKTGVNGFRWHKRHDVPLCDRARTEASKAWSEKRLRTKELKVNKRWVPGTSILVEENEEL